MRLAEKVAIVTGAASGMGAATARRFGKEGAKVVIADMLEPEGKAVAADIVKAGGTAVFMPLNVTDEANWNKVDGLEAFCKAQGHSLIELAFSWLAAQPTVASIIAGATSPEQLEQNAKSAGWALSAADLAEIDKLTK